jgi:hypothetical protein
MMLGVINGRLYAILKFGAYQNFLQVIVEVPVLSNVSPLINKRDATPAGSHLVLS